MTIMKAIDAPWVEIDGSVGVSVGGIGKTGAGGRFPGDGGSPIPWSVGSST